jgi:hypothetical protein
MLQEVTIVEDGIPGFEESLFNHGTLPAYADIMVTNVPESLVILAKKGAFPQVDAAQHSMQAYQVTAMDQWAESSNIIASTTYDIANSFYVVSQAMSPFVHQTTTLTGQVRNGMDNTDYGVTVAMTIAPTGAVGNAARASTSLVAKGLGSTGRTTATNLTEQLAMKAAASNPAAGQIIQRMKPLTDPRWAGWRKMQFTHTGLDGTKTVIHYNGRWVDGVLKAVDDFKFK